MGEVPGAARVAVDRAEAGGPAWSDIRGEERGACQTTHVGRAPPATVRLNGVDCQVMQVREGLVREGLGGGETAGAVAAAWNMRDATMERVWRDCAV
jgi:hypothetical protein